MAEVSVSEAPERLIQATIRLFAEQGPSAIKARTVASAAGLSTMVLYSHFGGIPELVRAVIAYGFNALDSAFGEVPVTDDPITDLATLGLTCREVARANPHLYDLMLDCRPGRPTDRSPSQTFDRAEVRRPFRPLMPTSRKHAYVS